MSRAPGAVGACLAGNLVVGCGVLVVPGMLDLLAQDLQISVPTAGTLLSLAALAMCIGAPTLASVTSSMDRRLLLVGSLMMVALGHLLCALAPDYPTLAWLRPLSVLGAAVFTPQAAAALTLLVEPAERPRAVTTAFIGWSLASVLGMPLGQLLAEAFGWRSSFAVVAVMGVLVAVWVWRAIPSGLHVPPVSLQSWLSVGRHRRLVLVLSGTLMWCAGHFTVAGYLSPALREGLQAGAGQQALLMALMGVSGLAGSVVLSRNIQRIGADRGARLSLALICVGLVAWSAALYGLSWFSAVAVAIIVWGWGGFAFVSAQQARLADTAPELASASIALNSSSLYAGQALGAALGGAVVATLGYEALAPIGLGAVALAWALSLAADRANRASP